MKEPEVENETDISEIDDVGQEAESETKTEEKESVTEGEFEIVESEVEQIPETKIDDKKEIDKDIEYDTKKLFSEMIRVDMLYKLSLIHIDNKDAI